MSQATEVQRSSSYRTVIEPLKNANIRGKLQKLDRIRLVSALYVTGVLLDYLFVYCVLIKDAEKCIDLDIALGFTALALRSLLELINVIIFLKRFDFTRLKSKLRKKPTMRTVWYISKILVGKTAAKKGKTSAKKEFEHFLMLHQILSVILVSLVFQVLLVLSLTSEGRNWIMLIALNYMLGPHLQRLFVVIKILLRRPRTTLSQFRTRWASLFFFVYIYSSQFFAALWYLPAIYKETRCWQEAYRKNTSSTGYNVFDCYKMPVGGSKNEFVSDYCSRNTTKYEFGIYGDVHEFEMLGTKSSPRKILYFSRWALQCLSSFAQGLEAGDDIWQNIFVIFIILYGVFMFFFLIAEVQTERQKLVKLKPKLKETENWMSNKNLSRHLQSQIKKYEQNKWPEAKDVNIENMIHNLHDDLKGKDLRGKLTQELCLNLLNKVDEFKSWPSDVVKKLYNCFKPVFYVERTQLIREQDPIHEMLFVVQGELWTYPSRGTTIHSESTSSSDHANDHMKDGDFYGEELVKRIQDNPRSFDFPVSKKNIQAVTNVEALVLMAYDLKKIYIEHLEKTVALEEKAQTSTQEA